jgi:sigma-E factor negative regulatory protein RseA
MTIEINKQISQFLDDELHHQDLDNLLVTINQHPELKNKLDRYQAVSHALRTDKFVKTNEDFLNNINQQIKQEPHHFLPKPIAKRKSFAVWQKASFAMAASIACISIIVSQQDSLTNSAISQKTLIISQQDDLKNTPVPQKTIIVAQKQTITKDVITAKANQAQKKSQHDRFKAYLQAHSDDLYTHGSLSVQPYARVAGYGQE